MGFGKGFSACFYGAALAGLMYFICYKQLKSSLRYYFGDTVDMSLIYLAAALTSEALTLCVQYPYDLIKCR